MKTASTTCREALLTATLARWEKQYTRRIIAILEAMATPHERLTWLIRASNSDDSWGRVHVALGSSIEEPAVARVLARVSKRRIAYLEECYRGLGSRKPRARQQALLAYAAYLGVLRLRVEGPGELPDARGRTWTRGVSRGDGGDAGSRVVKRGQRHEQRGSPCWHRQGRSAPSGGSGRAARAFA